jgi:Zn-dependent M16 (insulinase) family peptidase
MSALRVLTIDEIREYHHTYYEPYNTALVVCGPLDRSKLFESVAPVEQTLIAKGVKGAPPGWKRPFLETPSSIVPSLKENRVLEVVEFPEKDESVGEVMVSWIGPRVDDFETCEAISLLGTYLTDSAVSPVQQAFVEREDPFCTDVYFSTTDKAGATTVEAYFSSVPTEHIEALDIKLVDDVLSDVAARGIDMDRMKTLIRRERVKLLNMLETKPADAFGDVIINDFLYGKLDGSDLEKSIDEMRRFDILDKYTSEKWIGILQKYLIANARLVISGKPSSKLSEKLKQDTKDLVAKRKEQLGEEGLKKQEEIVKHAQKANDLEIPTDVLTKFKIPDVSSINWIGVGVDEEGKIDGRDQNTKQRDDLDNSVREHLQKTSSQGKLPFFSQFSSVRSNFLSLSVMFDTRPLDPALKSLVSLLLGSIWSLPVKRSDGSRLPYEDVVKGLDEDTLEYDAALGYGSGFAEMIAFEVKVEKSKYQSGFNWLRDVIWQTELSLDRIRVSASKIAQSLPEQRRNGQMMSWALARTLTHSDQLSANINNAVLKQSEVIPQLVNRLSTDEGAQEVLAQLAKIRTTIFRPENMIVNVAGDIIGLSDPHAPLRSLSKDLGWESPMHAAGQAVSVPRASQVLTAIGKQPARKGLITPLATIESSFAVFTAKGIESWQEKDSAALAVTVSILNALESYLWRYIRGAGLAYGASIRSDIESKLIHFTLYRSPDSSKAFLAAADVIGKLVRGEMDMDQTVLDSAKSSLCFSVADSQGTPGSAAAEAFTDTVLRDLPKGRGRRLLEDARKVTLDDVRRCLAKYIQPIFDPATSICAIASSPASIEEITDALQKLGYQMERRDLNYNDEEASSDEGSESGESEDSEGGSGASSHGDAKQKQKL